MKRNLLLISGIFICIMLILSTSRRILSLRSTSEQVQQSEKRLEQLKLENESLKAEYEYKKSEQYQESEIRNRLNLVKEGEAIVVVPREDVDGQSSIDDSQNREPNWKKWKELFFGDS